MVQGVYVVAQRCKITNVSISRDLKLFSTFVFTILILQIKWYYYLMLAIVDVEANYIGMALDTITEKNRVLSNISSFFITWVDADLAFFFHKVVKAYQYTSLTSVMLLDCWAIPCVILLTWIFLKTKYGWMKLFGAGVCVAGLVLGVFSDVHASDRQSSKYIMSYMTVLTHSSMYPILLT